MFIYTEKPEFKIINGYAVIPCYHGGNDEEVQGISWWTTDYSTASVYAKSHGKKGIIIHRVFVFPITEDNEIYSPFAYLIGGKGLAKTLDNLHETNLDDYTYGLCYNVSIKDIMHFDFSVSKKTLEEMSVFLKVEEPQPIEVPKHRSIQISMED